MSAVQIVFQILVAMVLVLAILQKEKWKMMLLYVIDNILLAVMFFAFERISAGVMSIVGAIRMLVFMIYALKKLKPNIFWLLIFEISFIALTIITWQDAFDLLPLFALMLSCFGGWQDNPFVLRLFFIFNGILYVTYEAIIGAYISLAVEILNLICTIIGFIYYSILKKETPILQNLFKKPQKNIETDSDAKDKKTNGN